MGSWNFSCVCRFCCFQTVVLLFIFVDRGWGLHNCQFLWMSDLLRCLKDQLYERLIFSNCRSFVNSLLHLVRSCMVMVFTYKKVATVKLRKPRSLVMQLRISYLVNGHQENYDHHRREFSRLARESSCC